METPGRHCYINSGLYTSEGMGLRRILFRDVRCVIITLHRRAGTHGGTTLYHSMYGNSAIVVPPTRSSKNIPSGGAIISYHRNDYLVNKIVVLSSEGHSQATCKIGRASCRESVWI